MKECSASQPGDSATDQAARTKADGGGGGRKVRNARRPHSMYKLDLCNRDGRSCIRSDAAPDEQTAKTTDGCAPLSTLIDDKGSPGKTTCRFSELPGASFNRLSKHRACDDWTRLRETCRWPSEQKRSVQCLMEPRRRRDKPRARQPHLKPSLGNSRTIDKSR